MLKKQKQVRVKRNGLWIYVDYAIWAYSRAKAKERREAANQKPGK